MFHFPGAPSSSPGLWDFKRASSLRDGVTLQGGKSFSCLTPSNALGVWGLGAALLGCKDQLEDVLKVWRLMGWGVHESKHWGWNNTCHLGPQIGAVEVLSSLFPTSRCPLFLKSTFLLTSACLRPFTRRPVAAHPLMLSVVSLSHPAQSTFPRRARGIFAYFLILLHLAAYPCLSTWP